MKKRAKYLLWGSLILCCGCIDNTYDLNKEIIKEVTIAGNRISLPIGNFKPIVLDSLIDVNDIDLLDTINGVYSIKKSDVIDPIDIDIDPIKINIDPITHTSTFQFDNVTIEETVLNEVKKEQEFGVNEVSIEDLNESLPSLTTAVTKELYTSEMKNQIEALKASGSMQEIKIQLNQKVDTDVEEVAFELDYALPVEIKEITDITLNNLIQFKITNPDILDGVNKYISFTATFPEEFVLRLDKNAPNAEKYSLSNNNRTVSVTDVEAKGEITMLQFYIEKMVGLSEKHVNGSISLEDKITYVVEYSVNGEISVSANTDLDDFKFLVGMNHKVSFEDAKGCTNDIEVDFEQMDFDFSAHFDNLDLIKEIEYIEFDAANSIINFTTDLGDGGFEPFNLKQGCQLKLSFPANFVLDLSKCRYPEGVTYSKREHAFFISDVNELHNFTWELAVDRIDVYTEVIDDKCDLNAMASISVVSDEDGVLKLGEADLESLNSTLESLKSKNVTFTMGETHLTIDDAVVTTEAIHEDIEEHTSFSINESIDDGVKRIEIIEFANEVPINLVVEMEGMDDLNTDVHLTLNVELPSFLVLSSEDECVTFDGGKMTITKDYNPINGKLEVALLAEKIDFTNEFNGGIELKDSTDGNHYLVYSKDIPIIGEASIDESEMHSTILGKDIGINVNFNIGEMEVEKFSGIYNGTIDDIHETIDFDLGEDLDFLKDDGNTITLSDPQIKFNIDNPVGVPVKMALSLFGKDDNGNIIETSCVETEILIGSAIYDEVTGEVITREMKFLLTNKETLLNGYTNVVIPNLGNLLKKIPSSLDIELIPTIDESVTHHVDLSKDLVFHPEYDIVVPVKFDNMHFEYSELIEDLNQDLGDALENFTNVGLKLGMNIQNTIPVGLTLTIEPLDVDGNVIEGVEIEDIQIAAGNGESVSGSNDTENQDENFQLVVRSQGDKLRKLDKLNLLIKADADETVGGEGLSPDQGIHITNIVLEVTGDVNINLDE